MSETVGARIKAIRAELELSQRAFAQTLGVSLGAVQSWEHDRSSPNAQILGALCELGFNGHWLVTGHGPARVSEPPPGFSPSASPIPEDQPVPDAVTTMLLEEIRNSGLGETLLLSRRGTQSGQWGILQVLLRETKVAKSVEEICAGLLEKGHQETLADVAADCRLLQNAGVIQSVPSPTGERYLVQSSHTLKAENHADRIQAIRSSIRVLTDLVAPRALSSSGNAYVQNAIVTTSNAPALLARLRTVVQDELRTHSREQGEDVHVILAMAADVDAGREP